MKVGSLFAGIGGFDLGLERAGFEIAWQVEIDPYCQRVLAKHWPRVKRYGDIKAIDWATLEPVDLMCGGFPCQPFSLAGKRRGTADDRYLWPAMLSGIQQLQPTWIIGENVPGLVGPVLDTVLSDLETAGYDVQTLAVPACAFDSSHIRQRIWIVAYSEKHGRVTEGRSSSGCEGESEQPLQTMADSSIEQWDRWRDWTCGWEREPQEALRDARERGRQEAWMSVPESLLGRVAHGVPARVDRLRGLGNAIVPHIAEWLGRQIMKVNL